MTSSGLTRMTGVAGASPPGELDTPLVRYVRELNLNSQDCFDLETVLVQFRKQF